MVRCPRHSPLFHQTTPNRRLSVTGLVLLVVLLGGCLSGPRKLVYLDDVDIEHYRDVATSIVDPGTDEPPQDRPGFAREPRRLSSKEQDEIWDLTLQDTLNLALKNSEIIRSSGTFLSPNNRLLANPDFAPSVFNPAIQETAVQFGQRGVEAALADFDAIFSSSMTWGSSDSVLRTDNLGLSATDTQTDDTGRFRSSISKITGNGSQMSLSHNWDYSQTNLPSSAFTSSFFGTANAPTIALQYRQPLLAGAGTDYTRVAGPRLGRFGGATSIVGVNQGVVIARINNDISLADFEAAVRNLVKDVEDLYWDLHLSYRIYHSQKVALDSSEQTWQLVDGDPRRTAAERAQARDNYFEIKANAEGARADIYAAESRLRRLLGLSVNDGRIIRPSDEPVTAEFSPDWRSSLVDALTRRVELRRQKWTIKSLQLQLTAANSLSRPQLDLVASYNINGFGDNLFDDRRAKFSSAYDTLTTGDYTSWETGLQLSIPIGFRTAQAQTRNLELRLAKARAALDAQEVEISHELAAAFQTLDRTYVTARTNFNRRVAAAERVRLFQAEYDVGRSTLDLLLRAQVSLAQAEISYFRSLVEYNKSITELEFRKGTSLGHNNVHLAENRWKNQRAYQQALGRAEARSHGIDSKLIHTEPSPITDTARDQVPPTSDARKEPETPPVSAPGAPAAATPEPPPMTGITPRKAPASPAAAISATDPTKAIGPQPTPPPALEPAPAIQPSAAASRPPIPPPPATGP